MNVSDVHMLQWLSPLFPSPFFRKELEEEAARKECVLKLKEQDIHEHHTKVRRWEFHYVSVRQERDETK